MKSLEIPMQEQCSEIYFQRWSISENHTEPFDGVPRFQGDDRGAVDDRRLCGHRHGWGGVRCNHPSLSH